MSSSRYNPAKYSGPRKGFLEASQQAAPLREASGKTSAVFWSCSGREPSLCLSLLGAAAFGQDAGRMDLPGPGAGNGNQFGARRGLRTCPGDLDLLRLPRGDERRQHVHRGAESCEQSCEHSRQGLVGSPLCKVKRRSQYYVVSVLGVMLGISSLVFTARPPEHRGFFLVVLLLLLLMLPLRIQISLIRMP